MKEQFEGRAYVLGNNIDTDQIIPAAHLVYSLSDPEERKNTVSIHFLVFLQKAQDCLRATPLCRGR